MIGEAFVARRSISRLLLLNLASVVAVACGLWLVGAFGRSPNPSKAWIGWLCILFFGTCAIAIIRRLFDAGEQIIVSGQGVYWKQWSEAYIPWPAIKNLEVRSVHGQRFACIYLHEPSRYPGAGLLARLAFLNKGLGYGDVAINVAGTDRSFDELLGALNEHWLRSRPR